MPRIAHERDGREPRLLRHAHGGRSCRSTIGLRNRRLEDEDGCGHGSCHSSAKGGQAQETLPLERGLTFMISFGPCAALVAQRFLLFVKGTVRQHQCGGNDVWGRRCTALRRRCGIQQTMGPINKRAVE